MKTNHKNFAKFSSKKAAVAEKKADPIIEVEEEEEFVFNTDLDAGLTDSETEGLLMDLPQILPPVEPTEAPEPPVEEVAAAESESAILFTPAPIETALFEV